MTSGHSKGHPSFSPYQVHLLLVVAKLYCVVPNDDVVPRPPARRQIRILHSCSRLERPTRAHCQKLEVLASHFSAVCLV